MAIRLRDVNPVIFLHDLSIGHSNQPNGSLDVRHDTDENRVFASFLNPLFLKISYFLQHWNIRIFSR